MSQPKHTSGSSGQGGQEELPPGWGDFVDACFQQLAPDLKRSLSWRWALLPEAERQDALVSAFEEMLKRPKLFLSAWHAGQPRQALGLLQKIASAKAKEKLRSKSWQRSIDLIEEDLPTDVGNLEQRIDNAQALFVLQSLLKEVTQDPRVYGALEELLDPQNGDVTITDLAVRHGVPRETLSRARSRLRERFLDVQRSDRWQELLDETVERSKSLSELRETSASFFSRAGRNPKIVDADLLRIPDPAVLAARVPPEPRDARRLGALLAEDERGFFLYRANLSERVEEVLDGHRLRGHPIAPLSYEAMRAALNDDACARILSEIEATYFRQQNLFEKKNALWDQRFFFGRQALLTRVGTALAGGDAILLTGLRKSGKSSFLNILRQHMVGHPWCHIDLQRFSSAEGMAAWPLAVAQELIAAIDRWGQAEYPGRWRGDFPAVAQLGELPKALEARRSWLTERGRSERPILVLDEVERVFPAAGGAEAADRLVEAGIFRAESQAGGWLTLITADLRPHLGRTNLLPNGKTNPFYQFFQEIPLPLFSLEETGRMVRSIGKAMGIQEIEAAFIEQLRTFSGGHPGFSRAIAAEARVQQADPAALTAADLTRALNSLHHDDVTGSFFAENLWGPATEAEREVLRWLAAQEGPASPDDAPETSQEPAVWATLFAQGLLRRELDETAENALYTIAIEGFTRWLRRQARRNLQPQIAPR